MASTQESSTLKKVLKPIHLWAIAVGLVISGDYFGWNYGWSTAGTVGFFHRDHRHYHPIRNLYF